MTNSINASVGSPRNAFFRATAILGACIVIGSTGCSRQEPKRAAGGANNAPVLAKAPQVPASGPFDNIFAWCWSPPNMNLKNLIPMLWVRNRDYASAGTVAQASQALPRGHASLFLWNAAPQLLADPLDTCRTASGDSTTFPSPWLAAGAKQIGERMAKFFRAFKAAGGRMNYLVLDYEAGLSSWQISLSDMEAIERDPRSKKLKRQLGFPYLSSAFFAGPNRRAWNLLMGSRIASALNTAFFTPARASFPRLCGSNFGGVNMTAPYIVPDPNDHYQALSCVFGNCQSPAFYGTIGGLAYANPGGQPYGNAPFAILRYEMMYLQGIQSTSRLPVVPWVAYPSYAKTAGYYKELVYQLALRGVSQFLYWNPRQLNAQPGATPRDDRLLNGYLAALKRRLGPRPGEPITTGPVHWRTGLLVAARETEGGRTLYRVTAPPGTAEIVEIPGEKKIPLRGGTGVWVMSGPKPTLRFRIAQPTRYILR